MVGLAPDFDFSVIGKVDNKRIQVNTLPESQYLELKNGLHYVLGFKDTIIKTTPYKGQFKADLSRGSFSMYIYTDMIEHIMVGDTLAPLLRTNYLPYATHGSTLNNVFNPAYYMPLNKSVINVIEIDIRTDSGDPFPLDPSSKLVLTLHFRRDEVSEEAGGLC